MFSSGATGPPADRDGSRRITALDGLRGIAILLVMLIHFTDRSGSADLADRIYTQIANAGWIGVDLFFVLSGFLITTQLLDSTGLPRYFINFYARRTLRIFPLYYACLVAWVFVLPFLFASLAPGREHALAQLRDQQAWYWTYLSNWRMGLDGRWPGEGISVYWSLAIEEQFYLAWPAVVYVCGRRRLMVLCGALMAAALVSRVAMVAAGADPLLVYVSTPTRMDGLVLGALIAALRGSDADWPRVKRAAAWAWPSALACLALLGLTRRGLSETDPFVQTVGFTVIALLFGSLTVKAVTAPAGSGLGAVLRSGPLRFFGKYSYALYLVHLAVRMQLVPFERVLSLVGGWRLAAQVLTFVISTGLSVALAWLSWHVVEKHFLAMKHLFESEGHAAPRAYAETSGRAATGMAAASPGLESSANPAVHRS